jgi:hypothetical protein
MRLPVVGGHGPVQLDRHVGRHMQAVRLAAVERIAVLVLARDEIGLSSAEPFDAYVAYAVGQGAGIDRVDVRLGVSGRPCLDQVRKRRHRPARGGEERREPDVIIAIEKSSRFGGRPVQDFGRFGVRSERLAFLYPDGFELIDHRLVARQPWLALHDSIQRLEETQIEGNGRVVEYLLRIRELRLRRIRSL